jgi:hypothetical protein
MSRTASEGAASPYVGDRHVLGDFTATHRLLILSAIAICLGAIGAILALLLLRLIEFFTNLFFFGRLSFQVASPADSNLGLAIIVIPVIGALIIGVMARFGSERIRGHGIPEAIEAILLGGSKIQPRVAVLKPVSSAISIGSGGPFGAEGPIIMTAGAVGSLIAQLFHLTSAERKTLLVAGAAAGMSACRQPFPRQSPRWRLQLSSSSSSSNPEVSSRSPLPAQLPPSSGCRYWAMARSFRRQFTRLISVSKC